MKRQPVTWSRHQQNFLMHYPAIVRGESNDNMEHWQLYEMEIFPDKWELTFRDSSGYGDYKISITPRMGALNFSTKDEKGETLQLSAGFDRTAQLCEVTIQRQTRDPANACLRGDIMPTFLRC